MQRLLDGLHIPKLSPLQATLASLAISLALVAALLVVGIGFSDTDLPLYLGGGAAALGLAVLISIRPEVGAYVLTVSVFTSLSDVLKYLGFPSINKPLVALVAVSILANILLRRERPKLRHLELLFLTIGISWLLSLFVAENQQRATNKVVDFAKDFVIVLCFIFSLKNQLYWKRAAWLLLLSAGVLAAMGTYQSVTGDYQQTFLGFAKISEQEVVRELTSGRLTGPIDDPNYYGQMMAAVLPLAVYRALDEKKLFLRVTAAVIGLLIIITVMNTYSRGAFVAMAIVLFLIAIERHIKFSWLMLVGLSAGILMLVLPAGYTQRISSIFEVDLTDQSSLRSDSSIRGRTSEMQAGLLMFGSHPFLGVGAGNYLNHYQDYASLLGLEDRLTERNAHSLYIETAAETGLVGVIALTSTLVALFAGILSARRKARDILKDSDWHSWIMAFQRALTSYLITSIFLHSDYIRYLWLLIALTIAMIYITDEAAQERQRAVSATVEEAIA
jgi:putative inorganic carbon (HCO3(-)) transporter